MQTVLETAHTWLLDSITHDLSGALVVRLVEGLRGEVSEFVEVGETSLGPCFPVRVEAESRRVEIRFPDAPAFFVFNESFNKPDPALKKEGDGRFLFVADASSFRAFVESRTLVAQLIVDPYQDYVLWCEDRVLHVLSSVPPVVSLLSDKPDPGIERTHTWSAN
jgi:hypothetical protein